MCQGCKQLKIKVPLLGQGTSRTKSLEAQGRETKKREQTKGKKNSDSTQTMPSGNFEKIGTTKRTLKK